MQQALAFLQQHSIRRSSLFISTKAGFMPGEKSRFLQVAGSGGL